MARVPNDPRRKIVTPRNIREVFGDWLRYLGGNSPDDSARRFYSELFSPGEEGPRTDFWAHYIKPRTPEEQQALLGCRDRLLPQGERRRTGSFFTPPVVVRRAYELLSRHLGENWQERYLLWDMCCGVGNLLVPHRVKSNLFLSTLDRGDLEILSASGLCRGATVFQYDYLNDDITDGGQIDYSLTGKVPAALKEAIHSQKKLLVLINHPFAEAARRGYQSNRHVARTRWAKEGMKEEGMASNELYAQFAMRAARELPGAILAMFSTLKYVNAPNFQAFRAHWHPRYLGGFIIPSKVFRLRGNFPIGFLLWQIPPRSETTENKTTAPPIFTEVLNHRAEPVGTKAFRPICSSDGLNRWIPRPRTDNIPCLPLKNAFTPAQGQTIYLKTRAADTLGYLSCAGNDFQQAATLTALYSSVFANGHGLYVTEKNFLRAAVVFTVRRIFTPTWYNNRDQFRCPNTPLSEEFQNDSLLWTLFNNSNLTASADGLKWGGKRWSIVSHFIPYTEEQVAAPAGCFESTFTADYLRGVTLSPEAQNLYDAGRLLWRDFFTRQHSAAILKKYRINRPDPGWFQIRRVLTAQKEAGEDRFAALRAACQALTEKLRREVLRYGFLTEEFIPE